MPGDISRNTFDRSKHYRAVYLQQGRLQLDADWNEQVDIQLYRLRTTAADLVGPTGALQDGFEIDVVNGRLTVRAGHLFAGGLLCELDTDTDLESQPTLPGFTLPTSNGRYLVYLDLWEQDVTAAQDPDLLEPALGGQDTTTRTRAVCQVKLQAAPANATCANFSPPAPDPPGIIHHYAPLAVVSRSGATWTVVSDCRPVWQPVTETLSPNKVDRRGDAMTGPLTIDTDLSVTGRIHIGGTSLPDDGVGAQLTGGALQPAVDGLAFGSPGKQGFLYVLPGMLALDTAKTLALSQGGNPTLIITDPQGFIGINQATPAASLHVGAQTHAIGLQVTGDLKLTPGAAAGSVLTSDAGGLATWQPLPALAGGSPGFFSDPIAVASNTTTVSFTRFTFDGGTLPDGTSAVILEAEAQENDKDFEIHIRKKDGAASLLLLKATALGSNDDIGWANQGIFPLDSGGFEYEVSGGVTQSWAIRAVGYFL